MSELKNKCLQVQTFSNTDPGHKGNSGSDGLRETKLSQDAGLRFAATE